MSKTSIFRTAFREYTTVSQLGQGGAGRVFEVRGDDGRPYALKLLDAGAVTAERKARFRNEIAFCQQGIHPGIVRVLDVGFVEDGEKAVPFYVMQLYGRTLRSSIRDGIDPRRAINLFMELSSAVSAAHAKGVSHRDLKPENILVADNGAAVIADFGIARFSEIDAATLVATREGTRLANFQYAAPEQREKGADVGPAADVYALGLIGQEMFTGQVPWGEGARTVLDAAPPFSFLDSIFQRMRQQDPENRPQLQEVIGEIQKMLPPESEPEGRSESAESSQGEVSALLGKLGEIAARVGTRHEYQARRKRFRNSFEGVELVRSSLGSILDLVQKRALSLRDVVPFELSAQIVSPGSLEVKAGGLSGVPSLQGGYANALDGAHLTFTIWRGSAHLPGRMFFDEPEVVFSKQFDPDMDESGAVVWKSSDGVLSETDLADNLLALMLETLERELG